MVRLASVAALLSCLLVADRSAPALQADEFERIEGDALAGIPRSPDAHSRRTLTLADLDGLPTILRDSRSALLIATTDQGNLARLLVSPALRKPPEGKGKPVPVLVVERFDTYEAGRIRTRLARGTDRILFDGFRLDLDSGQIVPEGQGGDLQFLTAAPEGPRLSATGKSTLYTLAKPLTFAAGTNPRPSSGRTVLPADFNGRYRLFANGQWSGTLDLKVADGGRLDGHFRSDLNGTVYPVEGQVAADVPQKVTFTIKYPRTQQEFVGRLWTEGKGAMAGTLTMLERDFGFFALRDGERFAPEGEDLGPFAKGADRPGRKTVAISSGAYTLEGQPVDEAALTAALRAAVAEEPSTWVRLEVPPREPFSAVNRALDAVQAAGISSIRVAPRGPGNGP